MLRRTLFVTLLMLAAASVRGQDRPLRTTDADVVPPGTLRAEVGFDFLQDADFPLSGLSGDLTSVGVINLRLGVGKIVEVELEGAIQQFLDVKRRGASFVPALQLTGVNSTRDSGNYALSTKVRILPEVGRRPSLAMRFGFIMPNSKQFRGIGTNTTNVFALFVLQKHFGQLKVFGNAGILILQSPNTKFSQNDELMYGAAFSYPVHRRVHLVGEVAGRQSSRKISSDLVGTESQSQARVGFQILAGGFQWDFAGIAGLTTHDPNSGFTFGITKDIKLFDIDRIR